MQGDGRCDVRAVSQGGYLRIKKYPLRQLTVIISPSSLRELEDPIELGCL